MRGSRDNGVVVDSRNLGAYIFTYDHTRLRFRLCLCEGSREVHTHAALNCRDSIFVCHRIRNNYPATYYGTIGLSRG